MAWWGPGGSGLRRGTRSIVRGLSPGPRGTQVVVALALVVAVGLVVVVVQNGGIPKWWPNDPPTAVLPGVGLT